MEVREALKMDAGHYEIQSAASLAEVRTHVLKHGDTFAVFDVHGDVTPVGNGEQGLYHDGMRYLSRMELWLDGKRPVLLSAALRRDNTLLAANLTNPDFTDEAGTSVMHGMLHFFRGKFLWEGRCHEHIRVRNYGASPVRVSLTFVFDADYADIFEVRGKRRPKRGRRTETKVDAARITMGYVGLDRVTRHTVIDFAPEPAEIDSSHVRYEFDLEPHAKKDLYATISAGAKSWNGSEAYGDVLQRRQQLATHRKDFACRISSANRQFDAWVERSLQDLNLLLTDVPDGAYPYAGIPWYNTYFGRDGILTALMTLWVNPQIARGVLRYLAETQAREVDVTRVAEPGKILHEARGGEMAATGEIPFGRYYGTVDATPLFVLLAGSYEQHTGDTPFVESIWPNVKRALDWIETYGDLDGDGFIEYREHPGGLTQQGWKDSEDSVFHADGELAEGPIALCEVQGYVYAAFLEAARLSDAFGEVERARTLRERASQLRRRIEEVFWNEELSMYALALDGEKRPCEVRTSNAGHLLFAGVTDPSRARIVSNAFFESDMFCGWGIRTLSTRERRYNPMSYHNGSVWPHDNAIIGIGLGRYGCKKNVHRLLNVFLEASLYEPQQRLPELFCGFVRREDEGPTPYPVACSPQAWATAVVFALLQAALGLRVDAARKQVIFENPSLPAFLPEVRLRRLQAGDAYVDLVLQRYKRSVGVEITHRTGDVHVVTVK